MTLAELKSLIKNGEGVHLEFKRKVADPVKITKEIVAFANKKGGRLIIGIDDDGTIPGLKHAIEEQYELEKAIAKHCKPAIDYTIERIRVNAKKEVLVFVIKESEKKPVYLIYNFKRNLGKAYIRVADKSVQTSREVRQVLKAQTRDQDGLFNYGKNEQALMQCFALNPRIQKDFFVKTTGINTNDASQVLVRLTIANVLELHPSDEGDYYTLKEFKKVLTVPNGRKQ